MEELLKYHIDNTEKRFQDLKEAIQLIDQRLEDMKTFKAEMMISSRWVSLIISAVCGILTMVGSGVAEYFIMAHKE